MLDIVAGVLTTVALCFGPRYYRWELKNLPECGVGVARSAFRVATMANIALFFVGLNVWQLTNRSVFNNKGILLLI